MSENMKQDNRPPRPSVQGPVSPSSEGQDIAPGEGRRRWRWFLLALGLLLCSLSMVLGAAVLGAYHGARDRTLAARQSALEHYQRGLEQRQAGNLELARAELEEALRLNPNLDQAREQLSQIQGLVGAQPTATSETRTQAVETLLAEAQSLYAAGQWEEAARRLETIRGLDPDFQPELLDELLFGTYFSAAEDLEAAGQDARALTFYEKALALQPESTVAQAARERLQLYQAALNTWGQDWKETIRLLERLHRQEPTYRDVQERLIQALESAGDEYRARGDWCLAAQRYEQALAVQPDAAIQKKARESRQECQRPQPTPTAASPGPTPAPTPTPAETGEATTQTGQLAGRILFSQHDPSRNVHQVQSIPAGGGEPTPLLEMASQPAVSPDGKWIAFHSWQSDNLGILVAPLAGGEPHRPMRLTYLEDIQPTWAPDSERLAFASNRHGDRKWRVYTTWVEGREEAQEIVFGEAPAWSPLDDRIVFRGCGPQCQRWGLYVTDDKGQNQELLLADPSATAPSWSPDGQQIAFMSNRDGNWELYVIGADGLGLRRLTNGPEHDGVPTWSPDGKWIAFLSHRSGAWGIYTLPVQPEEGLRLIHMVTGEYPDWMQEQLDWVP